MTALGNRILSTALALALLLAGLAGTLGAQAPVTTEVPSPYRISVNVNFVLLNVTVRDAEGRFVSDLHERDFDVREDGVQQSVRLFRHEDIPVTVGLVVDHSGSMRRKLPDVIAAARTFVHSSNPDDEMFVINFNEKVAVGLPVSLPFTNRHEDLATAIGNAPATGMTALYDAVFEARKRLQAGNREKRVLIVISDGGDNSSRRTLPEVLQLAGKSTTLVYTVGIFDAQDTDQNPRVLRQLASATGGEAFFPSESKDVVAICERIAHDIRNQYSIGYLSTNETRPGTYRSIRVTAAAPLHGKLLVRARTGYIAAGERQSGRDDGAK